MHVERQTPLKVIARSGPAAKRALERLSLDYCCHGDRALAEECDLARIDFDAVERALRDVEPQASDDWAHRGLAAVLDHVLGVRHPETRRRLDDAIGAVDALARATPAARPLQDLVRRLAEHASAQMNDEEQVLFARVRALYDARKGRGPYPTPPFRTIHEHEQQLREAHARTHELVRRARAIAGAIDAPGADDARRAIDEAAHALLEQIHLENNELLPRARDLEPALGTTH